MNKKYGRVWSVGWFVCRLVGWLLDCLRRGILQDNANELGWCAAYFEDVLGDRDACASWEFRAF